MPTNLDELDEVSGEDSGAFTVPEEITSSANTLMTEYLHARPPP